MNTSNTYDFVNMNYEDTANELIRLVECTSQTRIMFKTTEEVGDKLIEGFYAKYLSITEFPYLTGLNINNGNFGIKRYIAEAKWKEDLPIIYNKSVLDWLIFKSVDDTKSQGFIINSINAYCKNKKSVFIKFDEFYLSIISTLLSEYSIKLVFDSSKENTKIYKVSQKLDKGVGQFNLENVKKDDLIKTIIEKFVNGTMQGRNISVCTSEVDYIRNYFKDTGFDVKVSFTGPKVSTINIYPKEQKAWNYCRMIVATDNITADLYDYPTRVKVLDGIDSPLVYNKQCPGKMASAYGVARNVIYEEPFPAKEAAKITGNLRMKIAELNDIIKLAAEKSDYQVAIDIKHYPEAVIKAFKDAGYDFFIRDGKSYIAW